MKVYIVEDEPIVKVVSPTLYYRRSCEAYIKELEAVAKKHFWGLHTSCDSTARELYSQITGRRPNITNLVRTYDEANELFEHFKVFANVWAYKVTNS